MDSARRHVLRDLATNCTDDTEAVLINVIGMYYVIHASRHVAFLVSPSYGYDRVNSIELAKVSHEKTHELETGRGHLKVGI